MTEKQIERLLKIVSDVFKIEDITKQTRLQKYVQARTVVMKILRDNGIGTAQIGDLLNKHHSSIIHHTKNFDFQLRFDKKLHSKYETVTPPELASISGMTIIPISLRMWSA